MSENQSPTIKKQLKFIHITKCAGTTVEEIGKKQDGVHWGINDKEFQRGIKAAPPPWSQSWWLYPPQYMETKYLASLLEKYDFFTVVRNPYDRVISEYYSEWGGPRFKAKHVDEFNEYIHDRLVKVQFDMNSGIKMNGHYVPQYMYVVDAPTINSEGEAEARMICNIIIHLENFVEEFNDLMERYEYDNIRVNRNDVNMEDIDKLQNVMSVPRNYSFSKQKVKEFTKYDLSRENIELIQQIYGQDFELFNYSKDLIAPEILKVENSMECDADDGENEDDWEDIPENGSKPDAGGIVNLKKRSLDESSDVKVGNDGDQDSFVTGNLTITLNASKNKRRIVSANANSRNAKPTKFSEKVDESTVNMETPLEDTEEELLKKASNVQKMLSTGLSCKRTSTLPPVPNFGAKSWADYDEDSDSDDGRPSRRLPAQPQEPEQRMLSTYSAVVEEEPSASSPAPVVPIAIPAKPKFKVGSALYKKDGDHAPIRVNVSVAPVMPPPANAFSEGITDKKGKGVLGARHNMKSKSIQAIVRGIGNH